jgi:hypothetical protein
VVFGGAADCDATVAPNRTKNRRIIGFGAAAREDDLTGRATEHSGDVVASLVDRSTCRTRKPMAARRIRKLLV